MVRSGKNGPSVPTTPREPSRPRLRRYPEALVAHIAVQLLQDDDYQGAAKRALLLLEAVTSQMITRELVDEMEDPQEVLQLQDAIDYIVNMDAVTLRKGQSMREALRNRREYVSEQYKDFLREFVLPMAIEEKLGAVPTGKDSKPTSEAVKKVLKAQRKHGLSAPEAETLRAMFEVWKEAKK